MNGRAAKLTAAQYLWLLQKVCTRLLVTSPVAYNMA